MDKLSKDVLCLIALKLDGRDISSFCNISKRITQLVARNDTFWINKILKERPYFLSTFKDKEKLLEYRLLYNRLSVSNNKIYIVYFQDKPVHVKGKLKNYLQEDSYYIDYAGEFVSDKLRTENWSIRYGKNNKMVIVSSIADMLKFINLKSKSDEKVNEEELYHCCVSLRSKPDHVIEIENKKGFDMHVQKIELV